MLNSFFSALSMFSKIPVKPKEFDDDNGANTLCFLPVVGLICGAVTLGIYLLLAMTRINSFIKALLILFSLFIVSGFLHLDGFMDTSDALLSARDKEKKAKILKDSTVGAFSVICIFLLLLTEYVSIFTMTEKLAEPLFFVGVPFISRAVAAVILFTYVPLSNEGILAYFRTGVSTLKTLICTALSAIGIVLCFFIGLKYGVAVVSAGIVSLALAKIAERQIGGINGDIIGCCIVVFEGVSYLMLAILL